MERELENKSKGFLDLRCDDRENVFFSQNLTSNKEIAAKMKKETS